MFRNHYSYSYLNSKLGFRILIRILIRDVVSEFLFEFELKALFPTYHPHSDVGKEASNSTKDSEMKLPIRIRIRI